MSIWKMPPKAKVYEALSALADERVAITGPTSAQVESSSRNRTYDVTWSEDLREITSNDNASYWQGYMGYPIIAVLMKLGRLPFDDRIAGMLAGVPWKAINDRFKRDYDRATDHVLDLAEEQGANRQEIVQEVEKIYRQLGELGLVRAQRRKRPPKGK
ncbi:MAG: hypothetical protein JXO48_08030 [Deltaproteobacteria bacterium]|nr:hypothetical protein [Deltaproteobacteria bacterium]